MALRMLYSLPFFILLGWHGARSAPAALRRADWRELVILGVLGYYAASYLDFLGLRHISAALERVILFVYPTIVVLFTAWQQRRWPNPRERLSLLLCYVGIALAMLHDIRHQPGEVWLGVILVLGSALAYAVYLLRAAPLVQRLGTARVVAWATTVASILAVTQFSVMRPVAALYTQPWPVHALSIAMAVFSTVLPIWLVSDAIGRLGAGRTAIIGSLGPVLTMALAWAVLGEPIGLLQVAGALLVIVGVRLASMPQ